MSSRVQGLGLAVVLACALSLCSCSGSSGPAGGPVQSQQASLASLQGRYALSNSSMVGSLNFDGQGNVNGEVQFFDPGFLGLVRVLVSGTYSVGPDGRGTTSLKAGAGSSRNPAFSFVVLANGDVLFAETDLRSSDAGIMKRQDPSTFSFAALNGSYSFGPLAVSGALCGTGTLTIDSAGNITIPPISFAPDKQSSEQTFSAASIDSVTGNIDVSQASHFSDALYAVSSKEVFAQLSNVLCNEVGCFSSVGCQVERNTGPFPNAGFSSYALILPAFTQSCCGETFGDAAATFSVANGAAQSGTIDQLGLLAGPPLQQVDQPVTSGTFSVNPDGSCALAVGTNISATCVAVSPDFAFLQEVAQNPGPEIIPVLIPGLMTRRQDSAFALNSLAGDFGVVVSGIRRDNALIGSVSRLTFDGNGNVSGLQDSNAGPGFVQNNVVLQGTYTIASDGRGVMTVSSSVQTTHYAIYLASGSDFYLVGLDSDDVTGFGRK